MNETLIVKKEMAQKNKEMLEEIKVLKTIVDENKEKVFKMEAMIEEKVHLVLVKKGVIRCENDTQCDDEKQCLKQPDGMSRCQNPCERPKKIQ